MKGHLTVPPSGERLHLTEAELEDTRPTEDKPHTSHEDQEDDPDEDEIPEKQTAATSI